MTIKYNYGAERENAHLSFLKRVGCIAKGFKTGQGPKSPPTHTAKSSSEKRYGRNKAKCERYEREDRRGKRKIRNKQLQNLKKNRAAYRRGATE